MRIYIIVLITAQVDMYMSGIYKYNRDFGLVLGHACMHLHAAVCTGTI